MIETKEGIVTGLQGLFRKNNKETPTPKQVASTLAAGTLIYQCNICSFSNVTPMEKVDRESPSCDGCQSTVRMRQLMHIFSIEVFGKALPMKDFPVRKDLKGYGLSDWIEYAQKLSEKFDYKNTFYTEEPRLDITDPATELTHTGDFLISTDVFEHVNPPVQKAFDGTAKILKSGGLFIFSVPYHLGEDTLEHYPDLHDFKIEKNSDGSYFLLNKTNQGVEQKFSNLVFHGGPGQTLELRVFSLQSLTRHLQQAGFHQIKVWEKPFFEFGVYNQYSWSLPISARKI